MFTRRGTGTAAVPITTQHAQAMPSSGQVAQQTHTKSTKGKGSLFLHIAKPGGYLGGQSAASTAYAGGAGGAQVGSASHNSAASPLPLHTQQQQHTRASELVSTAHSTRAPSTAGSSMASGGASTASTASPLRHGPPTTASLHSTSSGSSAGSHSGSHSGSNPSPRPHSPPNPNQAQASTLRHGAGPNANPATLPVPIPTTSAMNARRPSPDFGLVAGSAGAVHSPSSPPSSASSTASFGRLGTGQPNVQPPQHQASPRKFSISQLVESSTSAMNRRKSSSQGVAGQGIGMPMRRRFSTKLALGGSSNASATNLGLLGRSPDEGARSNHSDEGDLPTSVYSCSPSMHSTASSLAPGYSSNIEDYHFTAILGRGASAVVYSAVHLPSPETAAASGVTGKQGFLSKSLDRALAGRSEESITLSGQKNSSPVSRCSSPVNTGFPNPNANKPVAVKAIDMDQFERDQIDHLRREIQIMSLCRHANLLPIYQTIVSGSDMYLITPLLSSGSCSDVLKCAFPDGMDPTSALTVMKQVLQGLAYLHDYHLIHRDVKAANILLDKRSGVAQLADFGVSSSLQEYKRGSTLQDDAENGNGSLRVPTEENTRRTFVGSLCWMAPEVMKQGKYGAKADLWSFGMTCLELLQGQVPYARFSPLKVCVHVLNHDPPYLEEGQYSKGMREMVNGCLQKNPKERFQARELLKHTIWRKAKDPSYLVQSLDLPSMNLAAWREEQMLKQRRRQLQRQQELQQQVQRIARFETQSFASSEAERNRAYVPGRVSPTGGPSRRVRNVPPPVSTDTPKGADGGLLSPGQWDFELTSPTKSNASTPSNIDDVAPSDLVPRVMKSGGGGTPPATLPSGAPTEANTHRVGRFSVTVSRAHRPSPPKPI